MRLVQDDDEIRTKNDLLFDDYFQDVKVKRTVKVQVLSCFGDIALGLNDLFARYIEPCMRFFELAIEARITNPVNDVLHLFYFFYFYVHFCFYCLRQSNFYCCAFSINGQIYYSVA